MQCRKHYCLTRFWISILRAQYDHLRAVMDIQWSTKWLQPRVCWIVEFISWIIHPAWASVFCIFVNILSVLLYFKWRPGESSVGKTYFLIISFMGGRLGCNKLKTCTYTQTRTHTFAMGIYTLTTGTYTLFTQATSFTQKAPETTVCLQNAMPAIGPATSDFAPSKYLFFNIINCLNSKSKSYVW